MTKLVEESYRIENSLHRELKEMKMDGGGEWFELTPEQALELAIALNRHPEIDMTQQIGIRDVIAQHERHQNKIEIRLDQS